MKLSAWAKQQGSDYNTAYRWLRAGMLPVPSRQFPPGTLLGDPPASVATGAVLYARVAAAGQKADRARHLARLGTVAGQAGLRGVGTRAESGSGRKGKRPRLLQLLSNGSAGALGVAHRERLARVGSEYLEAAGQASGRGLVVGDQSEMQDALGPDMLAVLTSCCARLYGRRSAKNQAVQAREATT